MDKKTEYLEWLNYADEDFTTAELLNKQHHKPLNIICYHCQQAAEKYLKAYLVSENISFEKTHDLIVLNKLCEVVDNTFANIIKECMRLNPYSVITRYPSELELIEQDATSAIESVQQIKQIVLKK